MVERHLSHRSGRGEYKETIKNAGRKLDVSIDAAMPRKKGTKKHYPFQETYAKVVNPTRFQKTKHARVVEAHESTRQRLESSLPKDHEDHIASKGCNSMTRKTWFTSLFLCLKR